VIAQGLSGLASAGRLTGGRRRELCGHGRRHPGEHHVVLAYDPVSVRAGQILLLWFDRWLFAFVGRAGGVGTMSLIERLLATVNRLPVGERAVRVGGDRLYVASLDRPVAASDGSSAGSRGPSMRSSGAWCRPAWWRSMWAPTVSHTLGLARRVGSGGRVHALDPT
jgi:hypothetical protein